MIQQTSLDAWNEVRETLGERQSEVLQVFKDNPDHSFTDQELCTRLGWTINRVTPRRLELQRAGRVVCVGEVYLHYTNCSRSVRTFKLNVTY